MHSAAAERDDTDSSTSPASVLGKANLLLEAFATGDATLGLTELSRRSGVSKASAHRLAVELVALGLLDRTPAGYELGWRIYDLGRLVPGPARLRAVAYPILMDLRTGVRGVVHLSMPQGRDCVYLERFAGRGEMTLVRAVGSRVPNHQTVSGRLFLANTEPFALTGVGPDVLCAWGVTSAVELAERISTVRRQRYAEELEQCVKGYKSVAVPVTYGGLDQVVAAISATVSVHRRDDRQIRHALWGAAKLISRSLERAAARPAARRPARGPASEPIASGQLLDA